VYGCQRPDRPEACVTFWDTASNERYTKYMRRLAGVAGGGVRLLSCRGLWWGGALASLGDSAGSAALGAKTNYHW
jgi:hypothetical protein